MSLMGSALGRGLAGAAEGAVQVANKYIDANLQRQRDEALAELQVQTAGKVREQDDAFRNDPKRIERDRANKVGDIKATVAATNEVALAGRRAEATDSEITRGMTERETALQAARNKTALEGEEARATSTVLTQAAIDRENAIINGTADTKTKAEVARLKSLLPVEVERATKLAAAQAKEAAKYREAKQTPAQILAGIEEAIKRPLNEQERLGALGLLSKTATDLATVTEREYDPAGNETRRTERKVPAGQGGAATADPIKAAMDAARAAQGKGAGAQAAPPKSLMSQAPAVAGRPYMGMSTAEINSALAGKTQRISGQERNDLLMELNRRKGMDDMKAF